MPSIVDDHAGIKRALEALREPGQARCPRRGEPCSRTCSRWNACEVLYREHGLWVGSDDDGA